MKPRYLPLLVALVLPLAGCVTITVPPAPASPSPSSSPAASATPEPSPTPVLAIPASCADLVPLDVIHTQYSTNFELIDTSAGWGGPVADEFTSRGGIVCVWGIPNSDAGAAVVYLAPLDVSAAAKEASWQAAGYTPCPTAAGVCYSKQEHFDELDATFTTVYEIFADYEIQVEANAVTLDQLLITAKAAMVSTGYV